MRVGTGGRAERWWWWVVALALNGAALVPKLGAENRWEEEARIRIEGFAYEKGFRVELFADSSQVKNPSAICFDDAGRLYVAEVHRWRAGVEDIRHHPFLLVEDLSIQSNGDRLAMYRGAAERGTNPMEHWTGYADRVRLVEDRDGDGRADYSGVFADGFDDALDGPGTGLVAGRGGIFFTNIPHLWWLEDADRDGVSERRESIQDGFGVRMGIGGHDLHGVIWGPDGRLYWSVGDRGYALRTREGVDLRDPVSGAVFRCEADGSGLEVYYTGLRNPYELAFDQYGNLFTCDSGADAWDEGRLVYVLEGGDSGWHAGHQVLLNFHGRLELRTPVVTDERDGKKRALNAWLGERLCLPGHAGQPAWILPAIENVGWRPGGLVYNYGGTAFPESYRDSFLVCNFEGEKGDLEMFAVERSGAGFVMRERKKAWMVGAGNTDAEFGPDGKLYLSCPNQNGRVKEDVGNIYTIYDPDVVESVLVRETRELLTGPVEERSGAELSDWLSHEDLRVRLRAQFELARRGEESVGLFEGAVNQRVRLTRRLHGIWGLGQVARIWGNGRAVRRLVEAAADEDAEVRAQAAKTLGDVEDPRVGRVLMGLLRDESDRVRCFAILSLARRGGREAWDELLGVLDDISDREPFLRHGAVVALAALGSEEELVRLANRDSEKVRRGGLLALRRLRSPGLAAFLGDEKGELVREAVRAIHDLNVEPALAGVTGLLEGAATAREGDQEEWLHQLRLINANWRLGQGEDAQRLADYASRGDQPEALRLDALRALESWQIESPVDPVTGLARPLKLEGRANIETLVRELTTRMVGELRGELLEVVLRLASDAKLEISPSVLRGFLVDPSYGVAVRMEAFEKLARKRPGGWRDLLRSLITDKDPRIRGAAVRSLLEVDPALGVESALILLETGEAVDKQQAVAGLAAISGPRVIQKLGELLDRAAEGKGDPAILLELLEAGEQRKELRERRENYGATRQSGRKVDEFLECLEGGDWERGADLYANHPEAQCNKCHKIGDSGGIAGPDLTEVGKRLGEMQILESLVDPTAEVVPGYGLTMVTLEDGSSLRGSLVEETDSVIVVRVGEEGDRVEIAKAGIVRRTTVGPVMPAMDIILTKRELRDLMAYLRMQKGKEPVQP